MCGLRFRLFNGSLEYLICSNLRTTVLESSFLLIFGRVYFGYAGEGGQVSHLFILPPYHPVRLTYPLLFQILSHLCLLLLIQNPIPILIKLGEGSRELRYLMLCTPQSKENKVVK